MRIIAGSAGGARIDAPKGMDTRPTLDKVRESLFNILVADVQGARVLDLFAGSGALGLEAVSRGAEFAALCDAGRESIEVVARNVQKLRYADKTAVERGDWRDCLRRLSSRGEVFDLAFLDPPYRMTNTGEMCEAMRELHLLSPGALVVIEHDGKTPPAEVEGFIRTDVRQYRETSVTFFRWEG